MLLFDFQIVASMADTTFWPEQRLKIPVYPSSKLLKICTFSSFATPSLPNYICTRKTIGKRHIRYRGLFYGHVKKSYVTEMAKPSPKISRRV